LVEAKEKLSLLHRSRIDIMANVLRAALGGAKKTHIMYKCNLSFRQLQVYLDLLVDRGLLRKVSRSGKSDDANLFETTKKGRAFLSAYRNIKVLLIH